MHERLALLFGVGVVFGQVHAVRCAAGRDVFSSGPRGYVAPMGLSDYRRQRRSGRSREQRERRKTEASGPQFVIQDHDSRNDFYDFRLEIDGVLVSWAIPRGASVNPQDRRLARRTADHPIDPVEFEDSAPDAAVDVVIWDHGTYANRTQHEMITCLGRGHLSFRLNGDKLSGGYALTRVREGDDETWLLVKRRDDDAEQIPTAPQPVLTMDECDTWS